MLPTTTKMFLQEICEAKPRLSGAILLSEVHFWMLTFQEFKQRLSKCAPNSGFFTDGFSHPQTHMHSFSFLTFFFFFPPPDALKGLWDLSSLTQDWTWPLALRARSSSHWTTREFPHMHSCFSLWHVLPAKTCGVLPPGKFSQLNPTEPPNTPLPWSPLQTPNGSEVPSPVSPGHCFPYHTVSIQFSHSVVSSSLRPHELQHVKLPCPSQTSGVCSNLCPLSQWRSWWHHPSISSTVIPCTSWPQSFQASGSFPVSQFFASGGQSDGASASASVLPMNVQDWFPLRWTCQISLLSKGLSRVINTTVQKHLFFSAQLFLWSNSHIHAWLLEKP